MAGAVSIEKALKAGHKKSKLPPGGGPPKPLCRNYGQLPKFTGNWVDHPDPEYRHFPSHTYPEQSDARDLVFWAGASAANALLRCLKTARTACLLVQYLRMPTWQVLLA